MALQTSGAISFANLQSEFGGANPITMGEYAAFRVSGSGNTISMNQFYGAAAALDTQTVTVGTIPANQYVGAQYGWTDFTNPDTGSVSDGTSNIYSGAAVRTLLYFDLNANTKYFSYVNAGNSGNTGWTTLTVNGTSYQRSAATYTYASNENTSRWEWSTDSTNPMGTTNGVTRTVEWT